MQAGKEKQAITIPGKHSRAMNLQRKVASKGSPDFLAPGKWNRLSQATTSHRRTYCSAKRLSVVSKLAVNFWLFNLYLKSQRIILRSSVPGGLAVCIYLKQCCIRRQRLQHDWQWLRSVYYAEDSHRSLIMLALISHRSNIKNIYECIRLTWALQSYWVRFIIGPETNSLCCFFLNKQQSGLAQFDFLCFLKEVLALWRMPLVRFSPQQWFLNPTAPPGQKLWEESKRTRMPWLSR